MAKHSSLVRTIFVLAFSMVCVKASIAQTSYYVDPAFAGTSRNGSASAPWQSLSDSGAWPAINTALASGNVTVFFSATGSSTIPVGLGGRTNTSANVLTLDGISQKDTNSASPSWTTNVVPSPCKHDAPGCAWASASKFMITANTPFAGTDSASNCIGYFTLQGFTIHNTEGQTADLTYIHDLTFQYNDASRTATGSYGPGIYIGPGQHGPCHSGGVFSGPDNVTVQYNYIHATWGECIYDGATTSDPPGYPLAEYAANGMTCGANCPTGGNHLIQGNTIESCASWGGQGDGTDIKDGHENLRIIGNTYRTTKACTNCGNNGPGNDGQGMPIESGALIADNYIEAPGHQCIAIYSSWNNTAGRGVMNVENNICVNANSGIGSNTAYHWWAPLIVGGVTPAAWTEVNFYNNTAYNVGEASGDACISVDSGGSGNGTNPANSSHVENNVLSTCGGPGLLAAPGIVNVHDYNDYYNTASCVSEPHGICTNPQFISTATPYADVNFELQGTSPAVGTGADLSSLFATDYFGNTRTMPWAMSAIAEGTSAGPGPNPPTGLLATVN
ncbi:MAG: hypothetical protein WBQ40_14915 [Candidatus Sulfotelmatobacter sp.]